MQAVEAYTCPICNATVPMSVPHNCNDYMTPPIRSGRPHVGSMAFDQQTADRLRLLADDIGPSSDAVLLLDAIRCLASDRSDDVKYQVGQIVRAWSSTHRGERF